jgi:DNA-binding transcriptional regulator LsrR (DeoR family)
MRHQFGLREAVVAPLWTDDYSLVNRLLGRFAAIYVVALARRLLADGTRTLSVGVAGGETMLSLALALQPAGFSLDIYPVVVGPHPDTELSAGAVAGIMARQLSGPHSPRVNAWPLLYLRRVSLISEPHPEAGGAAPGAELLVEADLEEHALEAARKVDIALVGIGSPRAGTTFSRLIELVAPNLQSRWERRFDRQLLDDLGLAGEIATQLLPPCQRESPDETFVEAVALAERYNETVTGIRLADLVRLASQAERYVVAVAGGQTLKLDAIHHALTCTNAAGEPFRPFNVLVTDAGTAEALLGRVEELGRAGSVEGRTHRESK